MSFLLVARRAPRFITSSIRAAPRQHAIAITAAKFTRSNRHQSTMSSDQQIVFTKNAPAGKPPLLSISIMLKLTISKRLAPTYVEATPH